MKWYWQVSIAKYSDSKVVNSNEKKTRYIGSANFSTWTGHAGYCDRTGNELNAFLIDLHAVYYSNIP